MDAWLICFLSGFVSDLVIFASNNTYKGKVDKSGNMSLVSGWGEGGRAEWERSVKRIETTEAPPRSAGCISCVFSVGFSLTLSSQPRFREQSREILTGKQGGGGKKIRFHLFSLRKSKQEGWEDQRKKKDRNCIYLGGRGTVISPACCMCSAHLHTHTYTHTLCFQMERKQGEVDHLELERPSPLTDKERVMIQDSWAKVFQNCEDVGVAILIR